jgi:hypothetical protein
MADGVLITKESARKLKKLLQGSPGGRSPGQHRVFRDIFVPRVVVITALPEETDEYTGKLLETERDEGPLEIKLVNLTEGPGGQRVMAMDQKAVCWRVGKDILTTEGYTLSEDTEVVFAAFDFGGGGDTGPGGSSLISTAKVTQVPSPGDYQAVEQTDEIGIGVEADTIDSTNIEFIEDEKVQLRSDDTLPAPFLPNTDYFVINAAGLVCQLASNAEGDPIDIEDAGTGTHTVIFKDRPPSEPPTWPIYTGQVLNDNYSAEDDEETEETEGPDTIEFVNLLDWPGREALLRLDDLVPIWRVPTDTLAAVGTEKVDDFAWRAETATFTADADEDTITAGDHEFSENEPLTFSSTGDLPEPLAVGTTYYA